MRVARLRLAHVLCLLVPLVASLVPAAAAWGAPPACADVAFIGARASGEPWTPYAGMGAAVHHMAGAVASHLAGAGLTMRVGAVAYPAEPTSDLYLLWRGRVGRYFRSIAAGAREAAALADAAVRACPAVRLVMAGYSQGAMAVHQAQLRMAAAHDPAAAHIAGTLLLGDGDRVPGTRAHRFGSAARGAAGIRTQLLPGSHRDVPPAGATADICDAGDLICDFRLRELAGPRAIRRAIAVHAAYAPRHGHGSYSPLLDEAAAWVASHIADGIAEDPARTTIVAGIGATFARWRAATGGPTATVGRVPQDLTRDRCLVLLVDSDLADGDAVRIGRYLQGGGTVLAVGERADGGRFSAADDALNALARRLGLGLTLGEDRVDPGPSTSGDVADDPLTSGVRSVGYDWASSVTVTSPARPLVALADGSAALVAAQAVGDGTFVLAGDSNLLTDDDGGAYATRDNGRLVHDLCAAATETTRP